MCVTLCARTTRAHGGSRSDSPDRRPVLLPRTDPGLLKPWPRPAPSGKRAAGITSGSVNGAPEAAIAGSSR
jgi:hypothetical protein